MTNRRGDPIPLILMTATAAGVVWGGVAVVRLAAMSPDQAAWVGAAAVVFILGARWLIHYLLCNCPLSRRGRAHNGR